MLVVMMTTNCKRYIALILQFYIACHNTFYYSGVGREMKMWRLRVENLICISLLHTTSLVYLVPLFIYMMLMSMPSSSPLPLSTFSKLYNFFFFCVFQKLKTLFRHIYKMRSASKNLSKRFTVMDLF